MMDFLIGIERQIFYFINRTCHHEFLDMILPVITDLGSSVFLFVLALTLLVFKRKNARVAGILLMAGGTFSHYIVDVIKNFVARPRPFLILENVNTVFIVSGYSFPSGHSTRVFLAAYILTKCFGKWRFFYGIAVIVVLSRVYLGVHNPSDILAGAITGTVIAHILVKVAESIGKMNGQVTGDR